MFSNNSYNMSPMRSENHGVRDGHLKFLNEKNNNRLNKDMEFRNESNHDSSSNNTKAATDFPVKNTHINPAFEESPHSSSKNSLSYSSLISDDNDDFHTVLRIDEDDDKNCFNDVNDEDVFDENGESKESDRKENGGSTGTSTNSTYEQEDTVSLLGDSEPNENKIIVKKDSKQSLYEDNKTMLNIRDVVDRRLSQTQDASEKIVNMILDNNNYDKYEDIPTQDRNSNSKKKYKKSKRLVKNDQILSTVSKTSNSRRKCCSCCGIKVKFICGVLCVLIGVLTTIWTPSEFLMRERLRMTPGLPAFDWWAEPPDDIYLRVYLFNYTNWEKFLSGEDTDMNLEQIGPIVYKEKLRHSNFSFNNNDTLTYLAHRWVEFMPELNTHIDLNSTIVVPNMPVLGMASYLHDRNYFVKTAFNILLSTTESRIFVNITLYDYLFNFKDPILETAKALVPQIVPVSNMGMLSTMYIQPKDLVTVYIGPEWGDEKFFRIDRFNGYTQLPGFVYKPSCKETVVGSTEGILYNQRITKNTTLLYWRKTLCKAMPLYFEDEEVRNGIQAYRFSLPLSAYHRTYNDSSPDCFASDPPLVDGLSDISRCFFDFPMALSLPHFLATNPKATYHIKGLNPNPNLHNSFLIVEPTAGIPIVSVARSQINLVIRKLNSFGSDILKFSDTTIPMFWAEYSQFVLPDYVWNFMKVQLKYIPVIEVILSVFLILLGICLTYGFFKQLVYPLCCPKSFRKHKCINTLARNAIMSYEQDNKQADVKL